MVGNEMVTKKRGRNRGHFQVRGNSVRLFAELPPDPVTGKRRQATKSTPYVTDTKAKDDLAQFLVEVHAGAHYRESRQVTFEALVRQFFAMKSRSLQPNTVDSWTANIETHIVPGLGQLPLDELSAWQIDSFYMKLLDSGGRSHSGLAPATIQKIHTICKLAGDQGVKWRWLKENPFRHATPPKLQRRKRVMPASDQIQRAMKEAETIDPDFVVYVRLAASLGDRRGEQCALRWTDVDFEQGTVMIHAAVILSKGKPIYREYPKNKSSVRQVALDSTTLGVLRAHKRHQAEAALALGIHLQPDAFVFSRHPRAERPWSPNLVTHRFIKVRNEIGAPDLRLHDLRHYVATQLLAGGVDVRSVAGRLGHANAHETLNTYAHWLPSRDHEAASLMGAILDAAED